MFESFRQNAIKRPGANVAIAIALMAGTALSVTAISSPAHAQKRKDDKAPKANFSKEFVAQHEIVNGFLKATPANPEGAKAAFPAMLAAISTDDDKMAAGGLIYNTGALSSDPALQRQGLDLMLESGKVKPENLGQYYFNSGQLALQANDYDAARARFGESLAVGYDNDLENIIASTYFSENRFPEGIAYYRGLIDAGDVKGLKPKEDWLFRAFSAAYNNDLALDAIEFANRSVKYYPSQKNWRNAISVQRNFVEMKDDVRLDLLRLAHMTGTISDGRDYADYIEAVDARRLPGEAKRLIDEAIAKGALTASDPFVAEARSVSNSRIAADKAELPSLLRDARKPGATGLTANAAGDVFLSYGEGAIAEEMFTIAETKPGVDVQRILTRKGIAQVQQGKFAEAEATFKKVGGARKAVAELWGYYAANQAAPTVPVAAATPSM